MRTHVRTPLAIALLTVTALTGGARADDAAAAHPTASRPEALHLADVVAEAREHNPLFAAARHRRTRRRWRRARRRHGFAVLLAATVSWIYGDVSPRWRLVAATAAATAILIGALWYLATRAPAARRVWPSRPLSQ